MVANAVLWGNRITHIVAEYGKDVAQRLPIGVTHDEAVGLYLGGPGCWETALLGHGRHIETIFSL
jgi:hypothetical protein